MIGKRFFLNARDGAFSEIPEAGSHQHVFKELSGHLVNITFKQTSKGETVRLHIVNDMDFYCVSMFVRSAIFNVLALVAKSLDLHTELKLVMSKGDTGQDLLEVWQYGNTVRWYYTKNNQQDMPEDKEERRAFLRKIIEVEMVEGLKRKANPFPSHPIYKPFGSGKGLATNYFGANDTRIGRKAVSDDELKEAGYSSYHAYKKGL